MPDGKLREIEPDDLVPGAVVREVSRSTLTYVRNEDAWAAVSPIFADAVVVEDRSDDDTQWVMLERPHASLQGTTLMIGIERIKVPRQRLCEGDSHYRLVCLDSGKPVNIGR